ncbi:Ribosomal protein L11 methyltransferase [Desulfurobacterium thermolithotrophum DSM 11699]|uniref:Ribosomal protein L11 methyltransferase n=1 Tax=Desulfurobacterium thermolithotrophum (strain DSM 11699 / BSA) TaxID=868864 RepID=F0S452_DESTD|nr:50S ribosomal protein L11 methyltransferase [Desulfurobacterium thermolithotrophum]ADY73624.1 Ribosomal protein L11 methyltransferase [Desulfurobacterium thermolithotrophum DSM 11699]
MKEYKVYEFEISKEDFEILEEKLFSLGTLGIEVVSEEERVRFRAYFNGDIKLAKELSKYLVSESLLKEKNWNEEWKKYFKPVMVSEKIWVIPSWMKNDFKVPKGAIPIYIYPGQTFGTGTHETTKLTMRFIEKILKPNDSFLDVGCGSGILSILAKKLGAKKVVGCDIQREVVEEVKLNSNLNEVFGIEVIHGSIGDVKDEFDIVVSNIEKHLLEPLIPEIAKRAKKAVVLSGVLKKQRDSFKEVLKKRSGLKILEESGEGEWVAFLCRK